MLLRSLPSLKLQHLPGEGRGEGREKRGGKGTGEGKGGEGRGGEGTHRRCVLIHQVRVLRAA